MKWWESATKKLEGAGLLRRDDGAGPSSPSTIVRNVDSSDDEVTAA